MYCIDLEILDDSTTRLGEADTLPDAWDLAYYFAVEEWGEGNFTKMITNDTAGFAHKNGLEWISFLILNWQF